MNKISKESIELSDKDLAAVSGGKRSRVIHMPATTIIVMPPVTIYGSPK